MKINEKFTHELKIKDFVESKPNNKGTKFKIVASHYGYVNKNNQLYTYNAFTNGVQSYYTPYQKPILKHHDDSADPIGRVVMAELKEYKDYKKYKNLFVPKNILKNQAAIYDLVNSPNYKGLGEIIVTVNMIDEEEVENIRNSLYQTVSIGGSILDKQVYCSICARNVFEAEYNDKTDEVDICPHYPGEEYDGYKCFYIFDKIEFNEISFVNVPADPHVMVLEENTIKDSTENNNDDNNNKLKCSNELCYIFSIDSNDNNTHNNLNDNKMIEVKDFVKELMSTNEFFDKIATELKGTIADTKQEIIENKTTVEEAKKFEELYNNAKQLNDKLAERIKELEEEQKQIYVEKIINSTDLDEKDSYKEVLEKHSYEYLKNRCAEIDFIKDKVKKVITNNDIKLPEPVKGDPTQNEQERENASERNADQEKEKNVETFIVNEFDKILKEKGFTEAMEYMNSIHKK